MALSKVRPASGHVFRVDRARGPVWFAKFRRPDGQQVQKRIGPAWTQRGRPAEGTFTKRTAEAWLERVLVAADGGELPMQRRSGVTFAMAAAEWLRYCEHERACKPTTLRDYRHSLSVHLLPEFGDLAFEDISAEGIERWRRNLDRSPRTKNKLLTVMSGVFRRARRAYGCQQNPSPSSTACASAPGSTSTSSRPRRSSRWCARRRPSRTQRSS